MAEEMMYRHGCLTDYEDYRIAEGQGKRINGATAAALGIGIGGVVVGVAAWIATSMYAGSKSQGNQRAIDLLATTQLQERQMQASYALTNQPTLKNYIDVATGGASAGANAASTATASNNAYSALPTGGTIPISLWQAPQPCCCPNPCGCNN